MKRNLILLWVTTWVPFWALPPWTLSPDQDAPHAWFNSHAAYHVFAYPFMIGAGLVGIALASTATTRLVRLLGRAIAVLQAIAMVGMAGELVALFQHGGFHAPESVQDDVALHQASAVLTVFGLFLTLAAVLVVTVAAIAAGRRSRHLEVADQR